MLSTLRHKGVSRKVLWFTTVIIVLSFGVFGAASHLDKTINSAGKIYGQSVSLRDYERAYLDSRDQAIMLYGERFFKMGNMIDLEREAFNRLILLHEAKKRHVRVDDKDVVEFIAAIPFFQRESKFDQLTYENNIRSPQIFDRTPKEFESGVRK